MHGPKVFERELLEATLPHRIVVNQMVHSKHRIGFDHALAAQKAASRWQFGCQI